MYECESEVQTSWKDIRFHIGVTSIRHCILFTWMIFCLRHVQINKTNFKWSIKIFIFSKIFMSIWVENELFPSKMHQAVFFNDVESTSKLWRWIFIWKAVITGAGLHFVSPKFWFIAQRLKVCTFTRNTGDTVSKPALVQQSFIKSISKTYFQEVITARCYCS